MKRGNIYEHFKGDKYRFICIALPLEDELTDKTHLIKFETARYHENTHDLDLYTSSDGAVFIDSDIPHVIYHSQKDSKMEHAWAREVDDFFGYKVDKGQFIKRFTLKIDEN